MNTTMSVTPQLFRGYFGECWEHFSNAFNLKFPPCTRNLSVMREPMKRFCSVTDQSLRRWLSKEGTEPGGEIQFRLMCFLDLHGYKIIELERLPISARAMAEIIGYQIMSAGELAKKIGYAQTQTLYDVLHRNTPTSDAVATNMRTVWSERKQELAAKKKFCFDTMRMKFILEQNLNVSGAQLTLAVIAGDDQTHQIIISIMRALSGAFKQLDIEKMDSVDLVPYTHELALVTELAGKLSLLSSKALTATNRG